MTKINRITLATLLLLLLSPSDPCRALDEQACLLLSSTFGGQILTPENSLITSISGQSIDIEAQSTDTHYFSFAGWSGSAVEAGHVEDPNQARTTVRMEGIHDLQACFITTQDQLFVDDEASDPEYGTQLHPLASIQNAIDIALSEMRISVFPGHYTECLDFQGKNLQLVAIGSSYDSQPIIDYNGPEPILSFTQGEDPNCQIQGFVITGGYGELGGAIYCLDSSPSFNNCLVVGNRSSDPNGSMIVLDQCHSVWTNCTLADNMGGIHNSAIQLIDSTPTMMSSIIWDNTPVQFVSDNNSTLTLCYCNVSDLSDFEPLVNNNIDNINTSPSFISPGYWGHRNQKSLLLSSDDPNAVWIHGNYHLQPSSLCINKGNPSASFGAPFAMDLDGHLRIQDNRIDIGADETIPDTGDPMFECPVLKQIVLNELWWTDDPTPEDMKELIELRYYGDFQEDITSLAGLEYATNLRILELTHNKFHDISPLANLNQLQRLVLNNNSIRVIHPLANLTRLTYLDFHDNKASDLIPLSGLTNLKRLICRGNGISDISPLAGLVKMEELQLTQNNVEDLSPLLGMTNLETLYVNRNPLSSESCNNIIPRIVANNPGLTIFHSCDPIKVTLNSTEGGSIINPGEGEFWYNYGDSIYLRAQAQSGYEFNTFYGSYSGGSNPTLVEVQFDMEITAEFVPTD